MSNRIDDKKIYELKKKGLTYQEIADIMGVTKQYIHQKCKQIFALKGEKEPLSKAKNKKNEYSQEIYKLRKSRMSLRKIQEELRKDGIKLSLKLISEICEDVFDEKKEEQPKPKREKKEKVIDGLDEKIYKLRNKGLTYKQIAQELEKQGINITLMTARNRYLKTIELKKEEPKTNERQKINNQKLALSLLKLIETRKASIEQLKIIAKYYNIDFEKVINSLDLER